MTRMTRSTTLLVESPDDVLGLDKEGDDREVVELVVDAELQQLQVVGLLHNMLCFLFFLSFSAVLSLVWQSGAIYCIKNTASVKPNPT